MILELGLLGGGLAALWLGSDLMVSCSAKVAWRARFPALLVGLTIVSIGTSLPEMAVSITGALDILAGVEASGVIIGDNMGSFVSQLLLVLGVAGFSRAIVVPKRAVKRDGVMLPVSIAVFSVICLDQAISRWDAFFLLAVYLGYNLYVFLRERRGQSDIGEEIKAGVCWREQHPLLDLLYLVVGISLVVFASAFVVDNAIELARFLEVDPFVVGVVLVGVGTSLPELVVSLKSARRGEGDISLGNVIGSNVTDLLLVTAVGAIIAGNLHVSLNMLWFDLPFALVASTIFLFLANKKLKIDRSVSSFLLVVFGVYMILKILGM